jgi:putative transposase
VVPPVAEHCAGHLHQITKRLATCYATVAIEDLHVAGVTRSAAGTVEAKPTTSHSVASV